jgi:antitoxin HigA-1
MSKTLRSVHPGEILREEFMRPLGLSMNKLALDLRVPVTHIAEMVHARRGITPDTELRRARYFNTAAQFWMRLQANYDLELAREKEQAKILRDVRPLAVASARQA